MFCEQGPGVRFSLAYYGVLGQSLHCPNSPFLLPVKQTLKDIYLLQRVVGDLFGLHLEIYREKLLLKHPMSWTGSLGDGH